MDVIVKQKYLEGPHSYRLGSVSGTMAASLGANSEIFQFRYVSTSKVALVRRVRFSFGANVAAAATALASFRMTAARAWTAAGTGGTRLTLTGNNAKLRTSYDTTSVNDAGISTTGALTAGTKTLDSTDLGAIAYGVGTGAITTSLDYGLIPQMLFDDGSSGLILATQEGFVIRTGAVLPAGMTWHFGVEVEWSEIPAP
jgi:hypothetical protein